MKKTVLALMFVLLLNVPCVYAYYTIDGFVDDWGIDLGATGAQYKYYLDNNTPSGGNDIDYITEDNADMFDGDEVFVGPGESKQNLYDAEAIYFDNDEANAYISVITGLPETGVKYTAGDIFIDTGLYQDSSSASYDTAKYAFGIDVETSSLYAVNSWESVYYSGYGVANPWKIGDDKIFLANIDFAYSANQNSHYVLEAEIPLSLLGLSADPFSPVADAWIHWTMECGNDYLNLKADVNPIPEPTTLLLFGTGLFGFGLKRRKLA